jgi:hypothetical protein
MNVAEFEDWLDRLGEDVSRWPESQRQAALALLKDSAEAQTLLEESRALRRALAAPKLRAPAGLADRIAAQATTAAQPVPAPVQKASLKAPPPRFAARIYRSFPAVALSLCFLLGLLVGAFSPIREAEIDQIDFPAYVAYVVDMAHSAD